MRNKLFFWLLAGITLFLVLRTGVYANGCAEEDIGASAQRFITQFHKDLVKGDKLNIKQNFLDPLGKETLDLLKPIGPMVSGKPLDDEDLERMVQFGQMLSKIKIEFVETNTLIKEPLVIEVLIREWYIREDPVPYNYDETLYVLKSFGACEWKIIEITAPGLP